MTSKSIYLVSDLWGKQKKHEYLSFQSCIPRQYSIFWLDACELGEVDNTSHSAEVRHQQFIQFGIEKATQKLNEHLEKADLFVGFSIGGLLLWKAAHTNPNITKLVAISSTRLRYETNPPPCAYSLYFGASDPYLPSYDWLKSAGKNQYQLLPGDHEFYKDPQHIAYIINDLKNKKWIDQE